MSLSNLSQAPSDTDSDVAVTAVSTSADVESDFTLFQTAAVTQLHDTTSAAIQHRAPATQRHRMALHRLASEPVVSFQTPQHATVFRLASVPTSVSGCAGRRPTATTRSSYCTTGTVVRTERKAVRVVGTMFAAFVACWTSFFVVNFVIGVCRSCHVDARLFNAFLWLGYASSIVNPIIYTTFNRAFKLTFLHILTCNICR